MAKLSKNYIGGEWVAGEGATKNLNPARPAEVVGEYAAGTADDVDKAVAAARAALPEWSRTTPQQRHDLLDAVGGRIAARAEEIGTILAREEGKTLPEAIGETMRAAQVFKFFGGEALRQAGELIPSVRPGIDIEVTREAVGVVGLVTPWNFPIAIPAWKSAPALAWGNCVVLKPAGLTPACAHILAGLLDECGAPPGVFNLVMGSGAVVGDALVSHGGVDAVSFTGSVETGSAIAVHCGQNQTKVQLEMGGKNPLVVMGDADLDIAVSAAVNGAYFSTGQRCTASSRLIVQSSVHDEFVDAVTKQIKSLTVGDPLQKETQIGPVVSAEQLASNLDYLAVAKGEGCEVVGGEAIENADGGYFQSPGLMLDTKNTQRINREEIFGPLASVIRFDEFDEALEIANDTDFGLSAGICTRNLGHARAFRKGVQAGMVMVNLPTAGVDYHVPFGGRKGSSFGPREQGRYAAEFYTTVKTSYISA